MSPPLARRSIFDPDYVDPMSPRAATMGALRGLIDASPVGAADLLHQALAGQSRLTMPGIVAGLLGVPQTPPPGEALAGLLGIDGSGDAYETGRAATNAATAGLLAALARAAPRSMPTSPLGRQAGVVKPEAVRQALEQWMAMQAGQSVPRMVRDGLVLTEPQLREVERAYQALTRGKQPLYGRREIDISTGHIFDSRISGKEKPSGQMADAFTPEEVARWLPVAGADDAAVRLNAAGKPYLSNTYVDPVTGERIPLQLPISGELSTGRLWVGGLVPQGKYKKPNP